MLRPSFLIDECITRDLAEALRTKGFEAESVAGANRWGFTQGTPDPVIAGYAWGAGQTIITQNGFDFLVESQHWRRGFGFCPLIYLDPRDDSSEEWGSRGGQWRLRAGQLGAQRLAHIAADWQWGAEKNFYLTVQGNPPKAIAHPLPGKDQTLSHPLPAARASVNEFSVVRTLNGQRVMVRAA
jgi:hypothetical protein